MSGIIKEGSMKGNLGKRIICPSEKDCIKTPRIKFSTYINPTTITTDCGIHQFELKLTDYLEKVANIKNKDFQICSAHKRPFYYYCEICKNDYCEECKDDKEHTKLEFLTLAINPDEEFMKINIDNIGSEFKEIFEIIINEYKEAFKTKRLNYSIISNFQYIVKDKNLFLEPKSNYENIINSYNLDINNITIKDSKYYKEKIKEENFCLFRGNGEYQFTANNKYFIYFSFSYIIIFSLIEKKEILKFNINNLSLVYITVHPLYENVFLTIENNNFLQIWEISSNEKQCYEKIKIKSKCKYAKFSPVNEFMLATLSFNDIKIWQLDQPFCIFTIKLPFNNNIRNINFSLNGKYIYYYNKNNLTIYLFNINKKLITDEIKIECNWVFVNDVDEDNSFLIIICDGFIIKKDILGKNCKQDKKINIDTGNYIVKCYCSYHHELLFIFSTQEIIIVNLNNFNIIFRKNILLKKSICINTKKNNDNIFQQFLCLGLDDKYEIYSFASKIIYKEEKLKSIKTSFEDSKWNKTIKVISEISNLNFINIHIDQDEIKKKKYLNMKEIRFELKADKIYNLSEKRKISQEEIEKFNDNEEISKKYINILKLMIKDNSNKKVLIKYLNILKKNEGEAKKLKNELFNDEINYYKIVFTQREFKETFKMTKKSEYENFIGLLEDIKICNKDEYSFKQIKKKYSQDIDKISRFNQPIKFENYELYWYRNRALVLYSFNKIDLRQFKLMKYCIEQLLRNDCNIFKNNNIVNNNTKLTFIMLLIVIPQTNNICNYNINMINSFDFKNGNDFIFKLEKEGFETKDKIHYYYQNENSFSHIIDINTDKSICLENVKLNIINNMKLEKEELYNYDYMLESLSNKRKINKIKEFLSNILCSKLFKELFSILYPNDIKYPFNSKNEAINYLNEYLNFIPMKSLTSNGATDKFTCEIYIFLMKKIYIFSNKLLMIEEKLIELIKDLLYTAALVKTNFHETNHNYYNNYYFISNCTIPLKTPRRENVNIRESGRHLELLLFNRIMHRINISEALYILNEKNYEKNVNDFSEDFNELKKEDLNIVGVFAEFNSIKTIKEFESFEMETLIRTEPGGEEDFNNDTFIDVKDENDVFGA